MRISTLFPTFSFGGVMAALFLLPTVSAAQGQAQDREAVNAKIAGGTCECVDKKLAARPSGTPLTKEAANQALTQCMMAAAGKDLSSIQKAYGTNAFSNQELMKQMGREVAGLMMQNCPNFTTLSLAMAGAKESAAGSAATTGQTVGQLGSLQGTALGLLEVQVGKTEKAEFAWLHRFAGADELLPQLPKLKGQQVRVSWQEVELWQPATQQYRKLREITSIEVL